MLNLLKEYSKKSPYRSRFTYPKLGSEFSLSGLKIPLLGGKYSIILESRFWAVLSVVAVLYFFAIETNNDWIYLITAGGVTALVLGLALPFSQVMDIEASCAIPPDHVAGDRLRVRVKLSRRSQKSPFAKYFPVKWIVVRIKLVGPHEEQSVLRPITVDTVITEAWVVSQSPPLLRGVYRMEVLETYSCFPFGLAWWSRSFDIGAQGRVDNPVVTVYPRVSGIEGNFLYRLRTSGSVALISSASRAPTAMPSSSVRSLREFVTGDSPRLIHWASSAKTGKLLVREFDSEGLPGYDVLIDLTSEWKNTEQFELAVSLVNSLLNMGFRMGGGPELYIIPSPHESPDNLPICLQDMPNMPPGIGRWSQLLARVEALVTVRADMQAPIPDMGSDNKLALLMVRPAETQRVAPDGTMEDAVDLWVMSRAFTEPATVQEKAESWVLGQRKVLPAHAGFSERRGSSAGPPGRILTSLTCYEDIAHL
ncbi:MAG: DUF58 domain-containing protein [Cyanobacteria bacterium]|nr:DUF58 domain-containing protein [Cyanobacteriota bacterium]